MVESQWLQSAADQQQLAVVRRHPPPHLLAWPSLHSVLRVYVCHWRSTWLPNQQQL
jgi:hypothetical protein